MSRLSIMAQLKYKFSLIGYMKLCGKMCANVSYQIRRSRKSRFEHLVLPGKEAMVAE